MSTTANGLMTGRAPGVITGARSAALSIACPILPPRVLPSAAREEAADHRGGSVVAGFVGVAPTLVRGHHHGKVAPRRHPDHGEVLRVAARVRQHRPAAPA